MQLKCLNFLQGGRERFLCAVPFRDLLQKFFPELLDTAGKKVSAGEQQAAMGSGAIAETIEQIFYKCDWRRETWEGICVFNGALSKSAKLVNDTAQAIKRALV